MIFNRAALNPRPCEQILQQGEKPFGGCANFPHAVADVLAAVLVEMFLQHLRKAEQRVKRAAEIVRNDGKKFIFARVQFRQFDFLRFQFRRALSHLLL